jgi:hypothetical protein
MIEDRLESLIPPMLYKLIKKFPNSIIVKSFIFKITGLELHVLPWTGSTVQAVTRITRRGKGLYEFSIVQACNTINIVEKKL